MTLFGRKAHDYGTAWRILRVPSLTDQIFIKAQRIRTLQQVGESKVGEGIRPELIGIINYAAMALGPIGARCGRCTGHGCAGSDQVVRAEVEKARDLMLRKNHDYGEAWRSMRVSSLVDLILMKLLRIKQIEDNQGATLVSEGIDANFLDIVNYGVFAMIRMGEQESTTLIGSIGDHREPVKWWNKGPLQDRSSGGRSCCWSCWPRTHRCWPNTVNVDSLFGVWNDRALPDSVRLKAMQVLAWRAVFERPDSGMALAEKQLELAREGGHQRALYEAFTTLAVGSSMTGDQPQALAYFEECADIASALKDDKRTANTLSNLGNVYRHMGDLPLALDHQQKSLAIYERLGDSVNMAGSLNNIGTIFTELNEPESALRNYERSAALYRTRNDQRGLAQATLNLGATHRALGEFERALEEFDESLALYTAMGRRTETGIVYNNLGQTYTEIGRIPEALAALANAESIFTSIQADRYLGRTRYYRGTAFLAEGRTADALRECSAGAEIAQRLGILVQQRECAECLMEAYSASGDFRNAFEQQRSLHQHR